MAKNQSLPMIPMADRRLPKWANGVIAVGSVVLVGFVVYVIYKSLKKRSEQKNETQTINQVKDDLKKNLATGGKLTWANQLSVYNTACNTIQRLLDGCEYVESELEVVKTICEVVKTQADWLKMQEVWGIRELENCLTWGKTKYNLGDALADQMDWTTTTGSMSKDWVVGGYAFKKGKRWSNSIDMIKEYFASKNIKF